MEVFWDGRPGEVEEPERLFRIFGTRRAGIGAPAIVLRASLLFPAASAMLPTGCSASAARTPSWIRRLNIRSFCAAYADPPNAPS